MTGTGYEVTIIIGLWRDSLGVRKFTAMPQFSLSRDFSKGDRLYRSFSNGPPMQPIQGQRRKKVDPDRTPPLSPCRSPMNNDTGVRNLELAIKQNQLLVMLNISSFFLDGDLRLIFRRSEIMRGLNPLWPQHRPLAFFHLNFPLQWTECGKILNTFIIRERISYA